MNTTPLSPANAQSVFQISELARLIAEYSDKPTICSLVRTCHLFFDLFVPLLWENVEGLGQLLGLFPSAETAEDANVGELIRTVGDIELIYQ